jgi:acyl carrier protein
MKTPTFEEFAEFVRGFSGLSPEDEITPETRFEEDLLISGDDGWELLMATEERFKAALYSKEQGYRKAFNLGPKEYLFHSEPTLLNLLKIFGWRERGVVTFTVGQLYAAVKAALDNQAD